MTEVTQQEFYAKVGPMNVVAVIQRKYPHTTVWREAFSARVVGKSVDAYAGGNLNNYPIVTTYFLTHV